MNIQRLWSSKKNLGPSERPSKVVHLVDRYSRDLNVTEDDLLEARELAAQMSTEDVRKVKLALADVCGTRHMLTNYPS